MHLIVRAAEELERVRNLTYIVQALIKKIESSSVLGVSQFSNYFNV